MSSREYVGERIVIWPFNIDCTVPRSRGRKVGLRHCVKRPRVEEVAKACERLGLDPIVEGGKKHPKHWHSSQGRVAVRRVSSKVQLLKLISAEVARIRGEKGGG